MRREEDLIPAFGQPVDETVEVAVPLWSEKQLGLLDREDDALDLARASLEASHQGDARRGRVLERCPDRFMDRPAAAPSALPGDETAAAERRREVDDRRRTTTIGERDSPTVGERRLDRELTLTDPHIRRREVEAGIEQSADREERVRLAGARLADQGTDRARTQHQTAGAAEVDDADLT